MNTLKGIPIEELRKHFVYDPESPSKLSTTKGRNVGYISVGSSEENPYKVWKTMYMGKSWYVHRLIWVMKNDSIDESLTINHIDNNPLNNLIENLEICTHAVNNRRTSLHTDRRIRNDNKLGITGVSELSAKGYDYIVGRVRFNGILHSKLFSVAKLGKDEAIRQAIIARDNMIAEFNIDKSAGFTDKGCQTFQNCQLTLTQHEKEH